jgi:predicted transcriptional regulator
MTRTQAIDTIKSKLDKLSDEQLASIADIADAYTRSIPDEDEATRTAIAEGLAQANRGEFASDEDVAKAFARFRS